MSEREKRYKIVLTKQAEKSLLKIKKSNSRLVAKIANNIDALAEDPMRGIPLTGSLKGLWKLRVGDYRIIYFIEKDKLVICVIPIGYRRDVYR